MELIIWFTKKCKLDLKILKLVTSFPIRNPVKMPSFSSLRVDKKNVNANIVFVSEVD